MENIKSDEMLYTNISYLHFKDKKINDSQFIYQMSKAQPLCLMNRDLESEMWKDNYRTKNPICFNKSLNSNCDKFNNSELLKDWLIKPCAPPTHKNYVIQDDNKICTKQHQFYNNITKRKDVV
jgi:hypothetical protein